ncbi:MAG: hypothetical protein R2873_22460 [Caldilineaceae bacterium]
MTVTTDAGRSDDPLCGGQRTYAKRRSPSPRAAHSRPRSVTVVAVIAIVALATSHYIQHNGDHVVGERRRLGGLELST